MSRLTERSSDGVFELKECLDCISCDCLTCEFITKAIQKLGEYEDMHYGLLKKKRKVD